MKHMYYCVTLLNSAVDRRKRHQFQVAEAVRRAQLSVGT